MYRKPLARPNGRIISTLLGSTAVGLFLATSAVAQTAPQGQPSQAVQQTQPMAGAQTDISLRQSLTSLVQIQERLKNQPDPQQQVSVKNEAQELLANIERDLLPAGQTAGSPSDQKVQTSIDDAQRLLQQQSNDTQQLVAALNRVEEDLRSARPNLAAADATMDRTQVQVNQPSADVQVQQPAPQVAVQQPAPEVNIQQPQPKVTVTQPAPQVTVEQPQPKVTVQQADPKVNVTQAEPKVTVQQPDPKVTVNQPKPDVTVQQAKPEVTVQQQVQPDVNVQQSQAEVKQEPDQPSAMSTDKSAEAPSQSMAEAEKLDKPVEAGKAGSEMGSQTAATSDQPAATTSDQVTASIDRTPNPVVDMGRGIVGRSIYGTAGDEIGDIEDVVMGPDGRLNSALVDVGGFLGFGSKRVAIDVSTLQLQGERLVTNMTDEQVKQLPAHSE